jgi:amino acid transporter
LLPFFVLHRAMGTEYQPFAIQFPTFSEYNINVGSKLALGALTGFEYIAILAGETRSPARNIGRSVVIASPIIALMFILGTSSVLAFVPRDHIDVIGPIPQTLSIGFGSLGLVGTIGSIAILGIAVRTIALMSIYFAGNTRLPMVAGWDRLLPAWFSRLHPKYKTPINSILFVGAVTLVLGVLSLTGVRAQEAFQLIDNAGGIFYALTYLALFAIPLFGMKALGVKAPWWLKIACASGFIVTLIYIRFAIAPITEVENLQAFALKIICTVLIANAVGVAIYVLRKRK